MLKALLKKQTLEFLSMFTGSGKTGKKANSKAIIILYVIVFAYAFGVGGFTVYNLADAICAPLCAVGMDWLFFALIGIMSAGLSVIFGIFTSQPMLYDAKDNDFLLSLPISASKILFSRMFLLYLQNLIFSILVFIPSFIVYGNAVDIKALSVLFQVIIMLVLPLLSLVIECVVGWIVALITSRMRKKTIATLVLSLALLGAYFYLTTKISDYVEYITTNSEQLGAKVINAFYPFYQMGLGAGGEVGGLLIFTGISVAFFAIAYFILSVSFIRIATTKRGAKKVKYTGQSLKVRSGKSALFRKELTRFFSTPMYMLNCGLGVILHIALSVFVIVKKDMVHQLFSVIPVFANHTLVMILALVSVIVSMNVISAPSISLEGKNIWILQTMPIDGWQVLKAKLKLCFVVNLPSSILCATVLGIAMNISILEITLAVVFVFAFVCFCAVMGLVCNLKMPNFNWTSEAVVVKQSASVLVSMLVNIGTVFALGVLYYLLQKVLSVETILSVFAVVMIVVTAVFAYNLKNNGSKKLMYLQ